MAQTDQAVEATTETQADLKQKLAEQTLLLQVSQQLTSSFDLTRTMPQVVTGALQAAQADTARLVLCPGEDRTVFTAGTKPANPAALDEYAIQHAKNTACTVENLTQATSSNPAYVPFSEQFSALAIWPLQVEQHFLGTLWLGYKNPHTFTSAENTFLSTLVEQAATAIVNAQSYQQAKNGRQWLEAILGSTTDPVLVVDQDKRISLLNHAAEEILAIEAVNAINQPLHTILKPYPELLLLFEQRDDIAEDANWTDPGGRVFSPRIAPVDSETADSGSFVLTLRDITTFETLNRNQAEFVRLVSHDLRSPLTYMQGFTSLLSMTGELNERQEGFVEKIFTGISQMATLVDNIQDAGRWDPQTGFYEMQREPSDLTSMIQDIVANHQSVAEKQNITLIATVAPAVPIVNIDSLMMERALINLVSNAIKYSPDGGTVTVSIAVNDDNITICVSDTGLGIPADQIDQLFKRGMRIITQEVKENRIKGSGLGLFIVRSVARRHNGDTWVESELHKGSQFYLSIPLAGANLVGSGE
ncbi:ATP-binding protein [Chloroflexota bacterium]